jgi:hypothetical protein
LIVPGFGSDNALHVGETADRRAVDGRDHIAGLKARCRGSAVGLHAVDLRRRARFAEKREQAGENHDRQNEIRDRAGGDDRRARADFLVMEALLAFRLRHGGERCARWRARLRFVAEELDVAAQWNRRNLPAGAVPVVETKKFRPEPERECQHFHAGPACDQEVTEFMEEDNDREHEQKGDHVADHAMA